MISASAFIASLFLLRILSRSIVSPDKGDKYARRLDLKRFSRTALSHVEVHVSGLAPIAALVPPSARRGDGFRGDSSCGGTWKPHAPTPITLCGGGGSEAPATAGELLRAG
jgi:hypothetical protein